MAKRISWYKSQFFLVLVIFLTKTMSEGQYFGATQNIAGSSSRRRRRFPSEERCGGLGAPRRQRNKETRPHCTDMEPAAILTRDKGDDYDDVLVVGLTIWQQEICRISEIGIFVVYLKWVYWPRLIVSYSPKTPHAQIDEWQGHKKHALRFTWQSI